MIKLIQKNAYFSNKLVQFMCESLEELKLEYAEKLNMNLLFYEGENTLEVLKKISKKDKVRINSVGFNIDYSPYAKKRNKKIIKWCKENSIKVYTKEDLLLCKLLNNETLTKSTKTPYIKFTPFYNYMVKNKDVSRIEKKLPYKNKIKVFSLKSNELNLEKYYKKEKSSIHMGGRKMDYVN